DPDSKQAFARVSEAYSVLGDDRQRCVRPARTSSAMTDDSPRILSRARHLLLSRIVMPDSTRLRRRMYDRTLGHRHATASHHPSRDRRPPHSQSYNAEWSFDPSRRAPGATHAWERRRPRTDYTQQQRQGQGEPQRPPPEHHQPTGFYQPFGRSASRQAAYSARMESVERELNRVQRVSSVGRAAQVTFVVFVALYLLSFARV
ncbi:hypothetical protein HDZ31DRAFT_51834, partial [Schizophyllum fasciatum]